ncbi:hypothetical protein [Dyadobacter subterraneus]|uniref:Por secretion system C-terminal sorting domain-containing protein n=2 Tax=Dyadobacter subterraneus TaxID=2773304 RepID=A0ABR9W5M3_9BACT|nr:hypothetical protein [Dyadobacter subterraneus]MBE9460748.1 hypothetical protein [Dyadobacter subterraneus]
MKTYIKNIAVAFAFVASFAFSAHADDKATKKSTGFGTGIYPTKGGKINVLVDKVNQETPTVLVLKNSSGDIVYREVIGKGNQKFGRALNLNDLEAGKYEIQVTSNGETQSKSLQLTEQKTERVLTIN